MAGPGEGDIGEPEGLAVLLGGVEKHVAGVARPSAAADIEGAPVPLSGSW